jgi:hypothetical protein
MKGLASVATRLLTWYATKCPPCVSREDISLMNRPDLERVFNALCNESKLVCHLGAKRLHRSTNQLFLLVLAKKVEYCWTTLLPLQ